MHRGLQDCDISLLLDLLYYTRALSLVMLEKTERVFSPLLTFLCYGFENIHCWSLPWNKADCRYFSIPWVLEVISKFPNLGQDCFQSDNYACRSRDRLWVIISWGFWGWLLAWKYKLARVHTCCLVETLPYRNPPKHIVRNVVQTWKCHLRKHSCSVDRHNYFYLW